MNTVTSLIKKHFGGRDKVSREHPGVMEYLREFNANILEQETRNKLTYCITKSREQFKGDPLHFYPSIEVAAPDTDMPPIFFIHAVMVSQKNQLFIQDYNGEAHEVTASDAPVIDALYNQLKKIAR